MFSSTQETLPARADIVIVGGGIMGASIAFHLAEAGVQDVLLVEADELGSGSSGKPIGGVRGQFSDPLNIQLGMRSLEAYRSFAERPGGDIQLEQVGYLFLLTDEQHLVTFEETIAIQQDFGVQSRMISPREVTALCPYVPETSVIAGAFSPLDGHARPQKALKGYIRAARALGVTVREGVRVEGLDRDGSRITAVHTSRGTVKTNTVICTAGAWSRQIGAYVDVDLPIRPVRRQLCFTVPQSKPIPRVPFTLDFNTTAYFHNADDNSLLFGFADPEQAEGFDRTWDSNWLDLFRNFAQQRAPELADMEVDSGWAGLYEVTPDHNAVIGEAESVDRFFYAAGFSGHGFLQAPAVGEAVRDLVMGRTPSIDVSPFSARRFSERTLGVRPEVNVI